MQRPTHRTARSLVLAGLLAGIGSLVTAYAPAGADTMAGSPANADTAAAPKPRPCAVAGPASVLECLETAYHDRDLDAYGDLLSADFRFVHGDRSISWDRSTELESTKHLFAAVLAAPEVEISREFRIIAGERPDTWVLQDVQMTLEILATVDGKSEHQTFYTGPHEVRVALAASPKPHYVITEWWEKGRQSPASADSSR